MIRGVMLGLVAAVMQGGQTFGIRKSITTNNNTFLMFITLIYITFGWGLNVNRCFFSPAAALRNCPGMLLLEVLKHGCDKPNF